MALLLSMSNKEAISSIRASVTKFSWSRIAEAIVNEYRAVLSSYSAKI
jgi:glycosyltransferase involved in cell wall biosynthesis